MQRSGLSGLLEVIREGDVLVVTVLDGWGATRWVSWC